MSGRLEMRKNFQIRENAFKIMAESILYRKMLKIDTVIRIHAIYDMAGVDDEIKAGAVFLIKGIQFRTEMALNAQFDAVEEFDLGMIFFF